MAESYKTQGTQIYFVDSLTSSEPAVIKMDCPTSVQGGGGTSDNIDDTCLEDRVDRSFTAGLGNPSQLTIPFVLKQGVVSHQILFDMWDAKEKHQWVIGFSDGVDVAPTLVAGVLTPPPAADRTSLLFTAYIADLTLDLGANEVVRGTMILQRSGAFTRTWRNAA